MKIFNRYPSDIFEKTCSRLNKRKKKLKHYSQYRLYSFLNRKNQSTPLKILCVLDRSCNIQYLTRMLEYQRAWGWINYKCVDLVQYLNENDSQYDLVIYQTWSSEIDYAPLSDQKFIACTQPKIFFDAHASGSFDTYYRFNMPQIPRIKNAPHTQFLKDFNVISKTSHPLDIIKDKTLTKIVDLSYCVGLQTHEIRPKVYEKVMPYQSRCRVDLKNNQHNYIYYLRRVKIAINVPGYGEGSFRHLYTLNAKALLLAHDSIRPIHLLPFEELKENEDYISFNLENIDEKIDWCLSHPKEVEEISESGYQTFIKGYNIERSAKELYPKLEALTKQASSV
ncbi:MAG: hypothetical protein S4CHLAM7_06920 [Chlamydiae bacterium]|nr:hypothetical protein [Chlamydiota bacterium]